MQDHEARKIYETAQRAEGERRFAVAAKLYGDVQQFGHAARCWLAAGDKPSALIALYRIAKTDQHYRDACVLATRLALALDRVDFDFDQFVGRFLDSPPQTAAELEAFYSAAILFERHSFVENARDVLERVLESDPSYRDAAARLADIRRTSRPSAAEFARVVREDQQFRAAGRDRSSPPPKAPKHSQRPEETFPSLPQIPPVPARPQVPAAAAPGARAPNAEALKRRAAATEPPPPAKDANEADPRGSGSRLRPMRDVFNVSKGFIVGERYRVEEKIGHGGMAAVYRAHDLELEETLALKLFGYGAGDPTMLSRFKQELALCRQIAHPNVIRLYDIGTHADARFITMELLRGADLCDRLDEPPDITRDLDYLVQLCRGLECVHERGVVHRDLKPENVFVTDEGVVKLMDFGIAKRRSASSGITMGGFSAGTPAYMAPEQINDFGSATHLSDLYSIGVIAYRLFAGVLPFRHDAAMAVLVMQLNERPAPPSKHNPYIPDELEFIILQLMEKEPAKRIQSCSELAGDLSALRLRLLEARRPRAGRTK